MNGLIIFVGGGLGAFTRYLLYLALPKLAYFPMSTLVANFLGCFIASSVFTYIMTKSDIPYAYKFFLITGFCGGLSTLSALSLELLKFIQSEEYVRALTYTLTTIFICTIAVMLGVILVRH